MGNSHVQKAKINHSLSACALRMKNQVAQACPSVPQAGRMTQHLWEHRHKIPSTANILRLNIFSVLPPYKPELDESHWHKLCATSSKECSSPLQLFGTHMGNFTLSADKNP